MRLPDTAVPSLGTQLMDGGPGPAAPDRAGAASPHLHDTTTVDVRGMAPTADSTSYDTDMDISFFQPIKSGHLAQPAKPAAVRPFPFCPPLRGFTVDGVGPPPPPHDSPTCGDVLRYAGLLADKALLWMHDMAFKPPAGNDGGANPSALLSLVCRQVTVALPDWESYHDELADREVRGRAAPRRSVFGLPLLHPLCGAALGWSIAMLLFDLVFTAFWVPVNVAFCLDAYGRLDAVCTRTDLAGGIVYLVNILLGFQVGVTLTCGYRTRVVSDGRDAARLYASTLSFWLDLLAVAPFVYLLVVLGMGDSIARHQTVSIISLMRLVRLFRVASIIKQLYSSSSGGEVKSSWVANHFSVTPMYMTLLTYLASVLVNLYACLLLLIAHYEQRRGRAAWMSSVSWEDVAALEAALRWYNAVYFTITVMTTTGYADFVPKSPAEQVLVSVMMLNGLVIFGTVVALIGSALKRSAESAQRAHDNRKQLTSLRGWLQEGEVPERVCRDVLTFFAELSARREGDRTESDIVFELPSHLRQKVSRHVVRGLLSQCPPLAGLPEEVRELLAAHCVPLELPTGHDLFRLGDDVEAGGGGMWLLEEGVVGAYRNQERLEMPVGPTGLAVPCLLGEGAVLADIIPACSFRMWTLRTERPCRIWQLREAALRASLQIYPTLATHVMLFVKAQILAWLAGQEEREEEGWCEVVQLLKRSFIMGPLRDRSQDCYLALQLAGLEDGTLPQLLAAWLEMSVSQEMTLKGLSNELGPDDTNFGPVASWAGRAATAATAHHHNLVTPAATPEQMPATPDPSVAAGRANRGDAPAAGSTTSAVAQSLPAAVAAVVTTQTDGTLPVPQLVGNGDAGPFSGSGAGPGVQAGGGGGEGGGGGYVQVGLPLPPPAAMTAEATATAAAAALPRRSSCSQLSDSGRRSAPSPAPSLPPAVEQAISRVETARRSRGGGGGGGSARGGSRSRSGAQSESGAAVGGGLRRAYSNSSGGAAAAIFAASRSSSDAAVDADVERERLSGPARTSAPAPERAPPPRPSAAGSSPFAALAASLPVLNGASPFDAAAVVAATAPPPPPPNSCTSGVPPQSPSAATWTAAAPPRHGASSALLRMGSLGSGGSPHVGGGGGASARWNAADAAGGAPRWVTLPTEGMRAAAAAAVAAQWPSPSAAPSIRAGISTTGWRRASFDAASGGGDGGRDGSSGQHVFVRPMSPPGPMSPTASPRHIWSDSSNAAAATAAAVRATPMSPRGPGVGTSHEFAAAVTAAVAAASLVPPAPASGAPQAAATALEKEVSAGRSTFIHKIFLAAGVNLQPPGRPSAAGTAGTAATAGPLQPQGPMILAPACAFCGCATCAYCARPIVPQGAAAAVRQLQPPARDGPMASTAAAVSATGPLTTAASGSAGGGGGGGSGATPIPLTTGDSENSSTLRGLSGSRGGGVSRQASGGEYGGAAGAGPSATRPPAISPARSSPPPRNAAGRLRPDRPPLGASALSRVGSGNPKMLPQLSALMLGPTRLRSSSGGVTAGGGDVRSRHGAGEGYRGSGVVSIRSGGGGIGGFGGGGTDTGLPLSPGAALAAAAASVSGHVGMAALGEEGERRPSAGAMEELLPLSGTMRLI